MTDQSLTATALMQRQENRELRVAMERLLHDLRPFMRAYPRNNDEKMPEHDHVWITFAGFGKELDNPGATILAAIKANPALWAEAIPDECCIVPKDMLKRVIGTSPPVGLDCDALLLEGLVHHGTHLVENQGARLRRERDERDREARYKRMADRG